jgi:SPP1 family predicted phage head-tail adaptor
MKCGDCKDTLMSRLRHKIMIQQVARSPDGSGGRLENWTTFATVFAGVEPLRGKEMYDHQQIQSEITHRIRIRYRSGVTPKMRVSFEGRIFRILSVINIFERDREMQLMCQEVADPR